MLEICVRGDGVEDGFFEMNRFMPANFELVLFQGNFFLQKRFNESNDYIIFDFEDVEWAYQFQTEVSPRNNIFCIIEVPKTKCCFHCPIDKDVFWASI